MQCIILYTMFSLARKTLNIRKHVPKWITESQIYFIGIFIVVIIAWQSKNRSIFKGVFPWNKQLSMKRIYMLKRLQLMYYGCIYRISSFTIPCLSQESSCCKFFRLLQHLAQWGPECRFLHACVSTSNQNYTIEFAVACRGKKNISDFLQGQEIKLNVVASGAGGSLDLFYFVTSGICRSQRKKGANSGAYLFFPSHRWGVTSSLCEQSPISWTEPPNASWSPQRHFRLMYDSWPLAKRFPLPGKH